MQKIKCKAFIPSLCSRIGLSKANYRTYARKELLTSLRISLIIVSMLFYSLPCSAYSDVELINQIASIGKMDKGSVRTAADKPVATFTTSEGDWSKTFTIRKVIGFGRKVYFFNNPNKKFEDRHWGFNFATTNDADLFVKRMNAAILQNPPKEESEETPSNPITEFDSPDQVTPDDIGNTQSNVFFIMLLSIGVLLLIYPMFENRKRDLTKRFSSSSKKKTNIRSMRKISS